MITAKLEVIERGNATIRKATAEHGAVIDVICQTLRALANDPREVQSMLMHIASDLAEFGTIYNEHGIDLEETGNAFVSMHAVAAILDGTEPLSPELLERLEAIRVAEMTAEARAEYHAAR